MWLLAIEQRIFYEKNENKHKKFTHIYAWCRLIQ